jgi:hypothetical protein
VRATGRAHPVGDGASAHPWIDAIGELAGKVTLPDSASFTESGRRLLVALGFVNPDPLRVEAETWLRSHRGPATEATTAVRSSLGRAFPVDHLVAARRFRDVK